MTSDKLKNFVQNQLFYTILVWFFLTALLCCQANDKGDTLAKGEALAKSHCATCHLLPDPSLLDKKTWREGVLPAMAEQFGIEVLQGNIYLPNKNSTLSGRDWQALVTYYESLAPDSLLQPKLPEPLRDWSVFRIRKPQADTTAVSSTIMTAIDPVNKQIYTSDLNHPALYQWDQQLKPKRIAELQTSAVDIIFPSGSLSSESFITCMGGMRAADNTKGDIIAINLNNKPNGKTKSVARDFIRPIQSRPGDFNKDGMTDYVICSFGHNQGGLYLLQQLPDKSFKKNTIREVAGATQAVVTDFNKDGWPDIMALFAHANEGIWLFTNDKKGGFTEKNLLRFPAVYGSSSFQWVDMNKDGNPDIVYTAGDNSDYSRILKPYHGLYIFTNEGQDHFRQTYFYPIDGCTKAIAADFDQDGDMDIAAIAFFADLQNNPSQKFLYFQHTGLRKTAFRTHALPIQKNGRWICMDVNDYDRDGDQDIVLGNFSKGFMNQESNIREWDLYTPFIVLENTTD
jgi:hypothetical protein